MSLLSGCENPMDEHGPDAGSPTTFTATIEGGDGTKTTLGTPDASGVRAVKWSGDDAISISGATYTVSSGEGTATATFTGSGAQLDGGKYKAYYPASVYNGGTPSLPAVQTYAKDRIDNLPMYAESSTTDLQFKNLCAVLEFKLTGTKTVGSIGLKSTEGKKLSGAFTPQNWASDSRSVVMSESASDTVTLSCGTTGVQLSSTEKSFFIAVPAQSYTSGTLRVTVKDLSGNEITSFTNSRANLDAVRSTIYEIAKTAATYVFTVTNPTDITWQAGTSTTGRVVSYKYHDSDTDANRSNVAWTVQGYYPTEADADAKTNAYSNIGGTYLTSFIPATQTGSYSGETVSAAYSADSSPSTTTVDPSPEITAKLRSNTGAYIRRGSSSSYWNLSNPVTGSKNAIAETANTYIVNAPGYYCFPLVMGNGVKNNQKNTIAYQQSLFVNYKGTALTGIDSPYLQDQDATDAVTPTTAYIVWEETNSIEVVDETAWVLAAPSGESSAITSSTISGQRVYWVNFHVTDAIAQGCAVIAVKDAAGLVMWSWTIWFTDYVPSNYSTYSSSSDLADVLYTPTIGSEVTFMPRNLGWVEGGSTTEAQLYAEASVFVRLEQTESGGFAVMELTRPSHSVATGGHAGHCPYYQWGRKDALIPSAGIFDVHPPELGGLYGLNPTLTRVNSSPYSFPDIYENTILNPQTFVGGTCYYLENTTSGIGHFWDAGNGVSSYGYSARDATPTKTIYDPCPAGYTVPRKNAFSGFHASTFTNAGTHPMPGYGRKLSSGLFFPAGGVRVGDGSLSDVCNNGHYWLAVPGEDNGTAYKMLFYTTGVHPLFNDGRIKGSMVRPAAE